MNTRRLPREARWSLFLYNLLFPFAFLAMLPSVALRMWRRGNFQSRFGQRLGRYTEEERARFASGEWHWIQSISVGETLIALKLARAWKEAQPEVRIVLSVTTSTGYALALEQAAPWLAVIYNPIDLPLIVRRTLDVLRPRRLAIVEGGLWPNLVAECRRRSIPACLVAARLSPRSARRFQKFRAVTGPIFRLLDWAAVPEAEDAVRWEALGLPREKLHVTGSIKFDHGIGQSSRTAEFRALAATVGVKPATPVLLAGSTHDGEETLLAHLLARLRSTFPDLVLMIAPRHVERVPAILRELAPQGFQVQRRTALQPGPCDILLIDSTGELRDWYPLATVVFIGKSLTAIGGQNPVEAILAGKPVLFGPHMENFQELAERLLALGAARRVEDLDGLAERTTAVLRDPAHGQEWALRAKDLLAAHQGATTRTVALLTPSAKAP